MISLIIIYTSWYLQSQKHTSNDFENKIQNARKRLSREAGVDSKDIMEMRLERKFASMERAHSIKQSNKLKYA